MNTGAVRVTGRLEDEPNRWLWLVKWLLLLPHVIVLALLWIAFVVLTAVALVAIVITTKYPRWIFDFNLGVLRWSWRVWFYGYGALATDKYPPFGLGEHADYPATLDVAYPEQLSRGLALVKWWLLAIPHYLILAYFSGGGPVLLRSDHNADSGIGLIALLALIAAVAVLFTGRYPNGLFDLVVGLNRWGLRVAAYAALMTDEYPPFRLDLGGEEPTPRVTEPPEPPATD